MNDAPLHPYLEKSKSLWRKALGALTGVARRRPDARADGSRVRTGVGHPQAGGFVPRASARPPLAPVFEAPDEEDFEPTRVFDSAADRRPAQTTVRPGARDHQAPPTLLVRVHDMMLAGALGALFAGAAEAAQLQHAGLGAPKSVGVIRFVAISSLLVVPVGALLGAALGMLWYWIPTSRLIGIRDRISAPFVYAAGVALPLMLAGSFRLFFVLRTNFQNESLAALASALMSAGLFGGTLASGFVVSTIARAVGRRYPVVLRRNVSVAGVLAAWAAIALPNFFAGPDEALRGPFGFIGLLRKDTLDYKPVVTLVVFAGGLALALALVVRLRQPVKIVLSGGLALWAAIATVRAGEDSIRPVVLEHGALTRAALRGLQRLGDWDGDGFSRWLGGGDCNDGDPRIHPGAREIPGNMIDEDCDGEDLPLPKAPRVPAASPRLPRDKLPQDLSFLFLTIDTLRPDLGYAGYPRDVSPKIDALAAQSIVYERAYSISTYTGYCLPPLMASRYPSEMPRTNRHEVRYLRQNVFLAERLKQAGFQTAGAASHFLFSPELGWIDGFDKFLRIQGEGDAPPGSHIDRYHTSRGLADAAISLLKDPEITRGRFFMWVHFLDPHHQYLKHPGFSKFGDAPRDLYDGEIAFTDFHVGRVLAALDASPLASRTVVVLTGDHGEAFGEHGEYFHGREIWDEIVRVPLLVRVPEGVPRRITRRVSHGDLAPTVLDLAGLAADPGARGQSLASELFGGDLPPRPILIDQPRNPYYEAKRAFIEGGLKLHHLLDSNTYRLYDLDRDPREMHELAAEDPVSLRRMQRDYALFVSQIIPIEPISPAEAALLR